jgi:hypothetical protein
MAFAILRAVKLKSMGEICGSLSHNYRTRHTPNADSFKTHLNEHEVGSSTAVIDLIKNRLPEKRRSDSVLCVEHLITASPEWDGWGTEKEIDFFNKSKQWLINKYGQANVTGISIHRDETTPHLVAYVVPLDESTGRLNCKKWLGGKKALSDMQTDFAKQVEDLGLKRGLLRSKANHKKIKEYYAEIETPIAAPSPAPDFQIQRIPSGHLPESLLFESKSKYADRIVDHIYNDVERQIQAIKKDMEHVLSQSHKGYQVQINDQQNDLDKMTESYERAVAENEVLYRENRQFIELKNEFPAVFDSLLDAKFEKQQKLTEQQEKERQKKASLEYQKDREWQARRDDEEKAEEFKREIRLLKKKRFKGIERDLENVLTHRTNEDIKAAATAVYGEKMGMYKADPFTIMNEVVDKKADYFNLCAPFFRVNSKMDFKQALQWGAESYESDHFMRGSDPFMARSVVAATVNRIDDLLLEYGGEYQFEAKRVKAYLAKHEEQLESESMKKVFKAIEDQKPVIREHEKTHAPSIKDVITEKERELGLDW